MIKHAVILISLLIQGLLWSQEYQLTNHVDFRYGGGTMNNSTNDGVIAKSASIVIGVPATGYAQSGAYNTDMGFYSFYLKEPDAPNVHASKGAYSNKIRVSWVQDPLSPPAYHRENLDAESSFNVITVALSSFGKLLIINSKSIKNLCCILVLIY